MAWIKKWWKTILEIVGAIVDAVLWWIVLD